MSCNIFYSVVMNQWNPNDNYCLQEKYLALSVTAAIELADLHTDVPAFMQIMYGGGISRERFLWNHIAICEELFGKFNLHHLLNMK